MSEHISKKVYYRIEFELLSAMNIGSGDNSFSDKDVIKNSRGIPYIPGTSIAGVYREYIDKNYADISCSDYFGQVVINRSVNNEALESAKESLVKVYDADVISDTAAVTKRDCVGLDEYKTVRQGAKFDFEVVEPGARFVTYIEQDFYNDSQTDVGLLLVKQWLSNGFTFGSKTMRGLGSTIVTSACTISFDFNDEKQKMNWLDFDMYDNDGAWKEISIQEEQDCNHIINTNVINISLKQKSGISIRKYTTAVNSQNDLQADYSQLTSVINGKEKPVIPGTSWSGAFRHHMEKLSAESLNTLFGDMGSKSLIKFSESIIEGAQSKVITRNAIDRFTAGTVDGALYTEKYYFDGDTTLTIEFPANVSEKHVKALVTSMLDLHFGYLAIGGLTSVGRGLFEITHISINDNEYDAPYIAEDGTVPAYKEWLQQIKYKEETVI